MYASPTLPLSLPSHLLLRIAFLLFPPFLLSLASPPSPFYVLVPAKPFFTEFVDCSNPSKIKGFSIDVFELALQNLSPNPSWPTHDNVVYSCYNYSEASDNSSYSSMVQQLEVQNYSTELGNITISAVIGDITIAADRLMYANFTQSYVDSGIVQLTRAISMSEPFPAVFRRPFTGGTWGLMGLSLLSAAAAIWLLECFDDPNFRGLSTIERCRRCTWYVVATLTFSSRQSVENPLTKLVMAAWTFLVILGGASYMASLSSVLTVYDLDGTAKDLEVIKEKNLSVGYQVGSIVKEYLMKRHNITNLIPLNGSDEYSNALSIGPYSPGGVATVVDEIPYISLFLAEQSQSNCTFSVSSTKLTTEGFGFAFRDGDLAKAFSVAILNLSESGDIHKLQDAYKLNNYQCPSRVQSTKLDLRGSWAVIVVFFALLLLYLVLFCTQYGFRSLERWLVQRSESRKRSGFTEPHFHRSMKRRASERHLLTPQEML